MIGMACATLLACGVIASAQESAGADEPLVVATKEAAPFSFRLDGGPWQGISIDLWSAIAEELGLEFRFVEAPLQDLITGLEDGRFDASVAALTVTADRERRVDFTHSFHPSGLGIAVPVDGSGSFLRGLFSLGFFQAVGTLVLILFLGGAVLWWLERKKNPEQFGGSAVRGLGSAFWWSAVTMTTVGYGDKAPVTGIGRFIAVVWMFAGVITISGLTAAIASALTVSRLQHSISGPDDLPAAGSIATVTGSTGEAYLREERLPYVDFETAAGALGALTDGRAGAAVYDAPILRYLAHEQFEGRVAVLPGTFQRQDYAIALPLESPLRKSINRALLERISDASWNDTLYRYLGATR